MTEAETADHTAEKADIVIGGTVQKAFFMSVVPVAGILYNLYTDPDSLARAFAPGGLPLWLGYFFVYGGFFLAGWMGIRLFGLWRRPLVARADAQGLYLKGVGLVPWAKVERLWFGAPFGDKPHRLGNCLFIDLRGFAQEAQAVKFLAFGFLADRIFPAGEDMRLRYWVPFVFFTYKDHFRKTVMTYHPQALRAADAGLPA
jgi:hypothetical protein